MRIALLSPYSWTYPGGVTRHIEALGRALERRGHTVVTVAPYDPDDRLARLLHRGAAPAPVAPPPNFCSLGRTVGFPANGAVSNLAVGSRALLTLREELRNGRYDVVHLHEPVAPLTCWDALGAAAGAALVGTYHSYSENPLTNGIGCLLGARRRMNRLHLRIAVSEAARWTATRFFGGRYLVIPNGVALPATPPRAGREGGPLRLLFIGQAVERKGLPVLLRAFEALREELPATLTLVGPSWEEVEGLLLEREGVAALGKVSEARKREALARADLLCAPSLGGESFGMVLTEGFAAGLPVVASRIPGYRELVRDGVDGVLVEPNNPLALAATLRALALNPLWRRRLAAQARARASRYSWERVAAEVERAYSYALARRAAERGPARRVSLRLGFTSRAALGPPAPGEQPADLKASPRRVRYLPRLTRKRLIGWSTAGAATLLGGAVAAVGPSRLWSTVALSKPSLVLGAVGLMGAGLLLRAAAWRFLLAADPTTKGVGFGQALRCYAIGVLASATLPARLGEPLRALVLARAGRRPRARLRSIFAATNGQLWLNLGAVAGLGGVALGLGGQGVAVVALLLGVGLLGALFPCFAPLLVVGSPSGRVLALPRTWEEVRAAALRLGAGARLLPTRAGVAGAILQLLSWALSLLAGLALLRAFGLGYLSLGGAAAVLFAVNVTALLPPSPGNVGVFQLAVAAALGGGFGVPLTLALAYGLLLQGAELAVALGAGLPALAAEHLSFRELRRQARQGLPVVLGGALAPHPA